MTELEAVITVLLIVWSVVFAGMTWGLKNNPGCTRRQWIVPAVISAAFVLLTIWYAGWV